MAVNYEEKSFMELAPDWVISKVEYKNHWMHCLVNYFG